VSGGLLLYAAVFLAAGALVVAAGAALARHGDAIADITGLGRVWVGSLLLAAATSLPELGTDVAAVRLGAPNLAVGDLFGSSMANMLILAIVDLWPPRRRVLRSATLDHALAACLAIVLTALAALFVLSRPAASFLGVGPGSLLLLALYVGGTRAVYRHVRRGEAVKATEATPVPPKLTLRQAMVRFGAAAAVVLAAAPVFAWSAKGLAKASGLGTTFLGTWLVGLTTSLPELATSLAAVRLGAFDLAVGNLFGSNAFNMAIFFVLDLVQPGNLFANLDPNHVLSALFGMVLTSLGLAAIVYRAERRWALLEPDSALMLLAYLLGLWILFTHTAGGL
jgi:cation:H+ antiporter